MGDCVVLGYKKNRENSKGIRSLGKIGTIGRPSVADHL